jgi:hypothetical protein
LLLILCAGGGVGSVQHVDCEVVMVHNLHSSSSERHHPPPISVIPKYRLHRVWKELKAQQAVCVFKMRRIEVRSTKAVTFMLNVWTVTEDLGVTHFL